MAVGVAGSSFPTTVNHRDIMTPQHFADTGATVSGVRIGTMSLKALVIDGTGGLAVAPAAGTLTVSATATIGTGLTVTSGGLEVTAGGILATAGDITAQVGNVLVNNGYLTLGSIGAAVAISAIANVKSSVRASRIYATGGTALVAGDIAMNAAWSTSTVTAITGTDCAGSFTITAAGGALAVNAIATLTFKNGTWTTVPVMTVTQGPGTGAYSHVVVATNATTAAITRADAPVAGSTYIFHFHAVGI